MHTWGVHSEVGTLRKVLVHRPDLSLRRLTPGNHDDLLFDDVLWVERAQYEHDQFVARMRERGVEVFYLTELLGEALADDDARMITLAASEYSVGLSLVDEMRSALWAMSPADLATHLVGGLTVEESGIDPDVFRGSSLPVAALTDTGTFVLPPLPNTLFTRDSSCWIYGGASVNPMFWPPRRLEAYNVAAIYRAHPHVRRRRVRLLVPGTRRRRPVQRRRLRPCLTGGRRRQPIGYGTVLVCMSERSQARMIEQLARALFDKGAAERVIVAVMSKDRAHMHLDTVFTMLDHDAVTLYPNVRVFSLRPDADRFHITAEDGLLPAVADAARRLCCDQAGARHWPPVFVVPWVNNRDLVIAPSLRSR